MFGFLFGKKKAKSAQPDAAPQTAAPTPTPAAPAPQMTPTPQTAPAPQATAAPRAGAELMGLIERGLIQLAQQPRNNGLDIDAIGDTKIFLFPIDHDYPGGSAAMHNAVFAHYGLNCRSAFIVADPANVGEIFAALKREPAYHGGGAGSGFKDKVGPHLDGLDQSAKTIGSVNVIARENGKLIGYNTDGIGFVNGLLDEYPNCIAGQKIVILGAGGTALPISYELARKGPAQIIIANRTVSKAQAIVDLVAPFTTASAIGEEAIGDALEGAGVVVNTSNKGAQPNEKFSAFAPMTGDVEGDMKVSLANLARLPKSAIVADILLEDLPLSLKLAAENGNRTHSGRHMNLFQAAPAFKIITKLDYADADLLPLMKAALA